MSDFTLRNKCSINTNRDEDTFVGIKCENGDFSISFPLGFDVPEADRELRKSIILLLTSIKNTTQKKDSAIYSNFKEDSQLDFPFQAYLELIYDFYARDYYHETEVIYNTAKRGKIDWSRTIKTQKTYVYNGNAFYLEFVTKKNKIKNNELITKIHEYLVYDSFKKIGWLFTDKLPVKPAVKYNEKLFNSVITEQLQQTFDDRNKRLFQNMLSIIHYVSKTGETGNYKYGTKRFEYVWEDMIDYVFGLMEKQNIFQKQHGCCHTEVLIMPHLSRILL